ncbi:M16 family metallopeptidase [Sphingomonas sp. 8AM]|uniref:M16 family metallopeptidase n=1 Tax=Sphingomonas sp. 8AM TaxID=2653170 RepID=UPI001356D65C|nr:pitrilysin family protein [Sphingomonas sp. 8AM]
MLAGEALGASHPAHRSTTGGASASPRSIPTARKGVGATDEASALVEKTKLNFDKFTLPNGLTVIVYPDHSVPKVLVSLTYRVGSKDEPEGKSGFAHLFEHMMFQETENRKGEYFKPLIENGAIDINGNTTTDRTRYFETVPTRELDLALWMESDRMQYLPGAIDAKALDNQRAVVKNEKRQRSTPESEARDTAYTAAFYPKGHPYDHPVIGSMHDLDNASVEDVRSWFDSYYGASNAILLLAGDVDPATAREKVARYFKDVRPGSRTQQITRWIPTIEETKRLRLFSKNSNVTISRSWPVPTEEDRDGVFLQSFAAAIAGDPQLPLNQALVENKGPALWVTAGYSDAAVNGVFSINAEVRPGVDPAEVERRIDAVLARLFEQGPDAAVLRRNLHARDKGWLSMLEDPESVGGMLESGQLSAGDPYLYKLMRRWEREVTPASLAAVARKWLGRPYVDVRTDPEAKTSPAETGSVDRKTPPPAPPIAADSAPKFPPIERATLANGTKLVVVRRPQFPLVSVGFEFETGRFLQRPYADYLPGFTFGSLFDGSKRYPNEVIKTRMNELAVYPGVGSDHRRSTVSFSSDSAGLADAVDFIAEVLREPTFPQKKIDEYIEQVDASFDSYEKNPAGSQGQLFNVALWGKDHPFARIETRAQAKHKSRDEMLQFYNNEIAPANMTAYFVGDITLDKARALVEHSFAAWHQGIRPSPTADTPPARPTGVRVVLIDVPGARQSRIHAGRLIEPWEQRRAMIEQLANGVLGGSFTSRINLNLREDKGWSYGVHSSLGPSLHSPRTFYVSGSVQTDRTAASIQEIIKELQAFRSARPITQTELDEQKTTTLNRLESALNSNTAYLTFMLDADNRGIPLDYATALPAMVRSISLDETRQVVQQAFRPDDFVWSIAGDLRKIEADVRALNLGPVEVQDVYGNRIR